MIVRKPKRMLKNSWVYVKKIVIILIFSDIVTRQKFLYFRKMLYLCMMISHQKHIRSFLLSAGCISLLSLQLLWVYHVYQHEHQQMMNHIRDAFHQAYQKEQTYRIPVVDIVNPGAITIQSCGSEEIIIVRKCPEADTIVYHNISGHSVENFINRVFLDLREQMVPLNIYCVADLFAGMLHDRNILVSFVIERFDTGTGKVLETSLISDKDKKHPQNHENTIISEISEHEAIRAIVQVTPETVFARMTGILIWTVCLSVMTLLCMACLYRRRHTQQKNVVHFQNNTLQNNTFQIGQYYFNPGKNELTGFGESIQLNKKENSILHALCVKQGNVVERNVLLEENWGTLGMIYSRSLDTYLTTLRKYLKKDPSIQIITVKGVGYKLVFAS